MRERYSCRKSICRWPIMDSSPCVSSLYFVLLGFADERRDLLGPQRPVVVEIRDHLFHERRRQLDRALLVAEVIVQDRQRELARALALVGPFESIAGEPLDLVPRVERL